MLHHVVLPAVGTFEQLQALHICSVLTLQRHTAHRKHVVLPLHLLLHSHTHGLYQQTCMYIVCHPLAPAGIGTLIEFWKVTKAMDVSVKDSFPFLVIKDRASYTASHTKEHDATAMRYLSYVLYPLVFGYSIYALVYETHKSWYSWVLNSLVGAVYMFGFILMCPQVRGVAGVARFMQSAAGADSVAIVRGAVVSRPRCRGLGDRVAAGRRQQGCTARGAASGQLHLHITDAGAAWRAVYGLRVSRALGLLGLLKVSRALGLLGLLNTC
jgi:hypothetical protein